MNLANEYGANQIWIANVGDLKPLELPIEFFLAMAWNPVEVGKDRIAGWTRDWAAEQFGPAHSAEIADLLARYAKYNAWRKPELLSPGTYSLEHYREAERACEAWDILERRADALAEKLAPDQQAAYFQLVLYPVRACAALTNLYVAAARNARFGRQGRASTNAEATRVRELFERGHRLRDAYNKDLSGGKWDHLMDQPYIGYFDWFPPVNDIMPAVTSLDLAADAGFGVAVDGDAKGWPGFWLSPRLPTLDSLSRNRTYIEVFPRGPRPLDVQLVADRPWVRIERGPAFSVSPEDRRYWIDIDWSAAPVGASEAVITVSGMDQEPVKVTLPVLRATAQQMREASGAWGTLAGAFAIPASAASRSVPARGVRWEAIPDYGRVDTAMSVFPVDAEPFSDPTSSPRLDYELFLAQPSTYHVDLVTGATLEAYPGRKLAVAVGIDDEAPVVQAVFTPENGPRQDFLGSGHAETAGANARTMRFEIPVARAGRHLLRVSMIDPMVVLQTIIVSRDPLPESYFGPPPLGPR
jgi:hypothetical protein